VVSRENEAKMIELLNELQTGLARARKKHFGDKRAAAKIAVNAVAAFVGSIPKWGDQHFDLIFLDLLTALRDLDQGIVHPMLEPKAFQNRKPASIHRKFLKSYVVHCTDRLHAAGMSIDEACRFVALESVQEHQAGLQSLRSMRRIEARRKKARPLRLRFSQSLASLRQRLSQAMVRSTTQRFGSTTNALA